MRSVKKAFFISLIGLVTIMGRPAYSEDAPCAREIRLRELRPLQFMVDADSLRVQRSQFNETDLNGWVEAEWFGKKLRFNHLAPGVGLPFDLVFLRLEVINDHGETLEEFSTNFPSDSECFLISIFPGGSTKFFDLSSKLENLSGRLRLRVRVFVPDHS